MNRAERRAFTKAAKKNGISQEGIDDYLAWKELGLGRPSLPKEINEDDKVSIDVEAIKKRQNYESMSQKYRDFVEGHTSDIFTAHIDRDGLISFKEHPEWLFWSGDLILVEEQN